MKHLTILLLFIACFFLINPEVVLSQGDINFVDITAEAGLTIWKQTDIGGWHGTYVCDYDHDGFDDMLMTSHGLGRINETGENVLFKNLGQGKFRNVLKESGLYDGLHGRFSRELHSAAWFDYDNDGDFDLYFANTDVFTNEDVYHGYDKVFENDGHGHFTDVSGLAGLPQKDYCRRGALALDIEGDGDLDLVFVNAAKIARNIFNPNGSSPRPAHPYNAIYVNQSKKFTLENRGLAYISWSEGITSCDYDNDGDVDIFIANQKRDSGEAGGIILWENDGRGFFRWNKEALPFSDREIANGSVTLGDVDNDGDLDLYCMAGLYINLGRKFVFRGKLGEPSEYMFFADLDNDCDLDLVSAGIFWNDGSGNFTQDDLGIDSRSVKGRFARGAIDIDFDNDGDLDVIFNLSDRTQPYLRFYRNDLGANHNWLKVKVRNASSGQAGSPGAKIWIFEEGKSEIIGYREITTATGFACGRSYTQHFGLAHYTSVDIRIKLVTGEEQYFQQIHSNQLLEVDMKGLVQGR